MLKHWPPLNALRGFEAAARLGSFHRAADELHLTQSAISQQIRSLESYLGQPLFTRTGRSVILTDAGYDLLSTTQGMLEKLAVGIRRLDQYSKPNQLIVNTTPAFAYHWLNPRLGDFHRQYPEADLWLLTTDECPDFAKQTIDIAVRDDLTEQAQCRLYPLLTDELYPACHPDLLDCPDEERLTLHGEREMDWSQWALRGGADVGQKSSGLNFSDPGLLLDAARKGLGIALVSKLLAERAHSLGQLQPMIGQTVRGPSWSLLVHHDSENISLVGHFCQWLKDQLGIPAP